MIRIIELDSFSWASNKAVEGMVVQDDSAADRMVR